MKNKRIFSILATLLLLGGCFGDNNNISSFNNGINITVEQIFNENDEIIYEGIKYKFNNNEFSVVGYEGEIVDVTIVSFINGYPVTSIGLGAFYGCSSLTSIELPSALTSIGEYAFSWCSNLTSIELPSSVTSIGEYAFAYCSSLTRIIIPEGVTSIGYKSFSECSSLTIYCEASYQSEGWNVYWNPDNRPVYYAGEWEYVNRVPTPIE